MFGFSDHVVEFKHHNMSYVAQSILVFGDEMKFPVLRIS